VFLAGSAYAVSEVRSRGPLPVRTAERVRYLSSRVRGFEAVRWLNRRQGGDYVVYGLGIEPARYYCSGRFLGDLWGPWGYADLLREAGSGAALEAFLRRSGVDFLVASPAGVERLPRDPSFAARFRLLVETGDAVVYGLAASERAAMASSPPAP
jgi:hypothetical protein